MRSVCFIVEGSYPYVTGGVAAWAQRLIATFRGEAEFHVVALTAGPKDDEDLKYKLPDNVASFTSLDLFDTKPMKRAKPADLDDASVRRAYRTLLDLLFEADRRDMAPHERELVREILTVHGEGFFKHLLLTETGFEFLTEMNRRTFEKYGFLKYYYNFRNIYLVFVRCLLLYRDLPEADIYHSPSAGFGGMLACLKSAVDGKPSVITEHGIYVQERTIELSNSEWLDEPYMRRMWIDFFHQLTRFEYRTVTRLLTLSHGNRLLQAEYGCPDERIEIIPNGIDLARFTPCRTPRMTGKPYKIGIVARVDPIKDVKTFLGAVAVVKSIVPEIRAYVIGPIEPEFRIYYEECRDLVRMLGIEAEVTFTGRADVTEYYRMLDVLLLTSVKEAMPLAVMEAMACGLPVVATNVGSCQELLTGSSAYVCNLDDSGQAGLVATVMDAQDIAMKTVRLLRNPELARAYGENGVRRIEKYYREEQVTERYRKIYHELGGGPVTTGAAPLPRSTPV